MAAAATTSATPASTAPASGSSASTTATPATPTTTDPTSALPKFAPNTLAPTNNVSTQPPVESGSSPVTWPTPPSTLYAVGGGNGGKANGPQAETSGGIAPISPSSGSASLPWSSVAAGGAAVAGGSAVNNPGNPIDPTATGTTGGIAPSVSGGNGVLAGGYQSETAGVGSPNLLAGVSADLDPNSPTGGTVTQASGGIAPSPSPGPGIVSNPAGTAQTATAPSTAGGNAPIPTPAPVPAAPAPAPAPAPATAPAPTPAPAPAPAPPSTSTNNGTTTVNAAGETVSQENAATWNVTPDQTVSGQYAQLMSAGNPAIQAAEEAQIRASAGAGGRSDLMAESSAAEAGSQIALTMATANAQVYASAAQYNTEAANTFAAANNTIMSTAANLQTQYGYQVRLGYLSSVSAQQSALQASIAAIESNPNITSTQAQGAVSDAINQFNTFVTQIGSYASALTPSATAAGTSGTYSNSSYDYNSIPTSSWPSPAAN